MTISMKLMCHVIISDSCRTLCVSVPAKMWPLHPGHFALHGRGPGNDMLVFAICH